MSKKNHSYKNILLYHAEKIIERPKEYDSKIGDRVTRAAEVVHDRVSKMPNSFWELLELFSDIEVFDFMYKMDIWAEDYVDDCDCCQVEVHAQLVVDWLNNCIYRLAAICDDPEFRNLKKETEE